MKKVLKKKAKYTVYASLSCLRRAYSQVGRSSVDQHRRPTHQNNLTRAAIRAEATVCIGGTAGLGTGVTTGVPATECAS